MENLMEKLDNPTAEFRPFPFWSWNDKLDPQYLRWQVHEMAKAGLGGYFMHARGGLETEYLSEDWFQCIEAGIDEGRKAGLNPWVYDEEGWPSGFAGGKVTGLGDEYHARGLCLEEIHSPQDVEKLPGLLGVYLLDGDNRAIPSEPGSLEEGRRYYAVYQTSGAYYIDIINEKVVKAFLDSTHEAYFQRFSGRFGDGLMGFFTDEPRLSEGPIPWSYIAQGEFRKRYGYDIVERLPALFLPVQGYERIRFDFWSMISDLFVTAFMKQIYDWCSAHHCQLTGHVMMEESIYSQMTGTAGSMPFYEYMHVPGMDWLRRTMGSPIVPKQVGSTAEQLGKRHVLTETYALTGWNISFEELKWMAEWQFVNGVNLMCQHLEGYTLRGLRKRDYPPSLFIQQPWWKEYRAFNDFLGRLGVLLTEGMKLLNTLVIHPMKSGYIAYDGTDSDQLKELDRDFEDLCCRLSSLHVDYHLGDETIMEKHGAAEGDQLKVGLFRYSTVILPSMLTMAPHTADLLLTYTQAGGRLVSCGKFPSTVGGVPDSRLDTLAKRTVFLNGAAFDDAVMSADSHYLDIRENGDIIGDIHCCQRQLGGCRMAYIINHSQTDTHQAQLSLTGVYAPVILELDTLKTTALPAEYIDGSTRLSLTFLPMQSHVLLLRDGRSEAPAAGGDDQDPLVLRPSPDHWDVEALDYNALTLDRCGYTIDGEEGGGEIAVIHLFQKLLDLKRPSQVSMKFRFSVDCPVDSIGDLFLVVEKPEDFVIQINGQALPYTDIGWWKDSSFKKLDIRRLVQEGENTIELSCAFHQRQKVYDVLYGKHVYETEKNKLTYDMELESIYLVGDFGVFSKAPYEDRPRSAMCTGGGFSLAEKPSSLVPGDFTKQGLCFFAGRVRIGCTLQAERQAGQRVILDLGKPYAAMSKLYINGMPVRTFLWAPYTVDITDYLKDGDNHLSVELYSGNRNLLGPHHHVNGELYNVGPDSFTGKWSWVERPTEAVPIDPADRVRDYWADTYCFTRFGI